MAVVEVSILVSNTIGSGGTGTWGTFCGVFSRDVFGAVSSVESVVDLLDVFGDVGIALAVVVTAYILTQIQSRIGHLQQVKEFPYQSVIRPESTWNEIEQEQITNLVRPDHTRESTRLFEQRGPFNCENQTK